MSINNSIVDTLIKINNKSYQEKINDAMQNVADAIDDITYYYIDSKTGKLINEPLKNKLKVILQQLSESQDEIICSPKINFSTGENK